MFIHSVNRYLSKVIISTCVESEQHVYYGYVPVGTDVGWPGGWSEAPQLARALNDIVDGAVQTFVSPEGTALLDIVGIYDNTEVEI